VTFTLKICCTASLISVLVAAAETSKTTVCSVFLHAESLFGDDRTPDNLNSEGLPWLISSPSWPRAFFAAAGFFAAGFATAFGAASFLGAGAGAIEFDMRRFDGWMFRIERADQTGGRIL